MCTHLKHSPETLEVVCRHFQGQKKLVLEKVKKESNKQQLRNNNTNILAHLLHYITIFCFVVVFLFFVFLFGKQLKYLSRTAFAIPSI